MKPRNTVPNSLKEDEILAILLCLTFAGGMAMTAHADESTLDFFKGLNFDDGLSVVVDAFHRFPLQYATTLGLDCNPQIRPIEFKFVEDGVLYFDTVTFYTLEQRYCWWVKRRLPTN